MTAVYIDSTHTKAYANKKKNHKETVDIEIKKYQKELDLEIALKGLHDEDLSEEEYFEEVEKILSGDYSFMAENDKRPLLSELYFKMRSEGLMPKVIVDYEREAFTFPAGNVRVTLDYHIRETHDVSGFLNPDCLTVPVITPVILEVKWDNFLPDIVKGVVGLSDRRTTSFSKYSASRIYG